MLETVSLKQGTGSASNNNAPNNTAAANNDTIKIYVNGSQVFPDSDPVIINDRTLVPIRVVAEALGYKDCGVLLLPDETSEILFYKSI